MDPAADALRRLIEEVVDSRLDAWRNEPIAIAKAPEPEPAHTGWITDRVPTEEDEVDGYVRIPLRVGGVSWDCQGDALWPGQPWAPGNQPCPGPWDPTTLDRNGWIRSRLPTKGDASHTVGDASHVGNWVITPIKPGSKLFYFQHYTLVVPGQPWAPCGSEPGPYQP